MNYQQVSIAFERKARAHAVSCSKKTKKYKKQVKKVSCTVEGCDYSFSTQKLLSYPFKNWHADLLISYCCSVCSKRFNQTSNYKRHLKTHRSQLDIECPLCHQKSYKYNLARHIKRFHGPLTVVSAIIEEIINTINKPQSTIGTSQTQTQTTNTNSQTITTGNINHNQPQTNIHTLMTPTSSQAHTTPTHTQVQTSNSAQPCPNGILNYGQTQNNLNLYQISPSNNLNINQTRTPSTTSEYPTQPTPNLIQIQSTPNILQAQNTLNMIENQTTPNISPTQNNQTTPDIRQNTATPTQTHLMAEVSVNDDVNDDANDDEGRHLVPLQAMVNGAQYVCAICAYTAGSSNNLRRHHESMHSETNVVCSRTFCDQTFPTKFMMIKHLAGCYLHCKWDGCEKRFKYKPKFESHQRAHRNMLRRYN
jgi:hypothetical protein